MEQTAQTPSQPAKARSPDKTDELEFIHITNLFLVSWMDMKGYKTEPFISSDGPFENMISFNIYGNGEDLRREQERYSSKLELINLDTYLKCYRSIRNQMWNLKELSKKRTRYTAE